MIPMVSSIIRLRTSPLRGPTANSLQDGGGSAGCGYNQEEQFTGPPKSQAALETLLTTQFEKLKKAGVLTKFKLFRKDPSCRPKNATRRVGRKSPAESATLFPEGTQKKGQDGKEWVVATTKAGVHRWVPAP